MKQVAVKIENAEQKPQYLTNKQVELLRYLSTEPELSPRRIMTMMGISKTTYYRLA